MQNFDDRTRSRPAPLSEEEAARILMSMPAESLPDTFTVLNRKAANPISEEDAARILLQAAQVPARPVHPLPLARPISVGAPVLDYVNKTGLRQQATYEQASLADAPIAYRIARVLPWLIIAVAMAVAMIVSALR